DSIFLVGADPRMEAPILAIRVRDAVKKGAKVSFLGSYSADQLHAMNAEIIAHPFDWVNELSAVLVKVEEMKGTSIRTELTSVVNSNTANIDAVNKIVDHILNDERDWIVLVHDAISYSQFATIRVLAAELSLISVAKLGYFTQGANSS